MKDRKFEIGVMVVIVTFSFLMLACYLIYDFMLDSKTYTLFLKPFKILECRKWNCEDVSNNLDKYNNKKYNVVVNGTNLGYNSLYYNKANSKFYVFNKNNENLYDDGNIFGYSGKAKISARDYRIDKLQSNDFSYIKEKWNLDFNESYVIDSGKISIDFDNDESLETLYYFYTGLDVSELEMYYEYVLYEDGSKFYTIKNNSSLDTDINNVGSSYVTNVLDIFDDGKLEFVLSSRYGMTGNSCDIIYRLKGRKYVPVNKCDDN